MQVTLARDELSDDEASYWYGLFTTVAEYLMLRLSEPVVDWGTTDYLRSFVRIRAAIYGLHSGKVLTISAREQRVVGLRQYWACVRGTDPVRQTNAQALAHTFLDLASAGNTRTRSSSSHWAPGPAPWATGPDQVCHTA